MIDLKSCRGSLPSGMDCGAQWSRGSDVVDSHSRQLLDIRRIVLAVCDDARGERHDDRFAVAKETLVEELPLLGRYDEEVRHNDDLVRRHVQPRQVGERMAPPRDTSAEHGELQFSQEGIGECAMPVDAIHRIGIRQHGHLGLARRSYHIFYLPLSDGIEVIRVLHVARDLEELL